MPNIQYIKNVTVAAAFSNSAGSFSKTIHNMPSSNPDEVIIRAMNFNGAAADTNLYLVWCSLTQDYIGSFCGGSLAPHFPQTTIWLNSTVHNTLEFRIYTPTTVGGGTVALVTSMTGDLAIHMDFIKYRNVPSHA